jgi:hypothetical protein
MKNTLQILLFAIASFAPTGAFGQKVKVGHDKATNFSRYKTYTVAQPSMPVTRPVLYEAVIARVDATLQAKGLTRVADNGDLTLMPSGGLDFGIAGQAGTPFIPSYGGAPPALNATMWTGASGPSSAGVFVTDGMLVLTFVDRASNKVVWSGSVKQKLDMEKKNKSLELADKAVIKLLKQFPETK